MKINEIIGLGLLVLAVLIVCSWIVFPLIYYATGWALPIHNIAGTWAMSIVAIVSLFFLAGALIDD